MLKLPPLADPQRYRGLYVYDFGEWTAVGYTADEVAVLLESEAYRGGKVYRIHRASPDGRMELQALSTGQFGLESGLFFYRDERSAAELDFRVLCRLADQTPPPCPLSVQVAQRAGAVERGRFVTAVFYPAEYERDVARWFTAIDYQGGDTAEGGISHVSDYQAQEKTILYRQQLWEHPALSSRSPQEVLASVRRAVQR